jgi:CBS domain-containing protein
MVAAWMLDPTALRWNGIGCTARHSDGATIAALTTSLEPAPCNLPVANLTLNAIRDLIRQLRMSAHVRRTPDCAGRPALTGLQAISKGRILVVNKSDEMGTPEGQGTDEEVQMTIARILAVKGGNVVTTQPHCTLTEVTDILAERGIGAIIVTGANGEVLGILSERDIVRAVVRDGPAALKSSVSKYMTAKVVTTTEEMSVLGVMEEMTRGRFRHVPVVKHGRLVGLVSIGDVVKHRLEEIESERQALREYTATA